MHETESFGDPVLRDVELRVAGRTEKHQLPGRDRKVGVVGTRSLVPPASFFRPSRLVAQLLLPRVIESFENGLANSFVPIGTGHAIDFSQHNAGNAMVVVAGA